MEYQELLNHLWYYDFEVFKHNWLVVFKKHTNGETKIIYDDRESLLDFIKQDSKIILCGYNNKNYDKYILKAIFCDINPKEVNDHIISGGQGWDFPFPLNFILVPPQIDLMQDTLGLGLKEIEGNIGWNIKETEVDFNIDRPLSYEEIKKTIEYCSADVEILPTLWELRQDYIQAKVSLCEIGKIPLEEGLTMTNAKLTAKFLNAKKQERNDEREFDFKKLKVDWNYIPLELIEYYEDYQDEKVDWEQFKNSNCLIDIGKGIVPTYGLGGVHYAKENFAIDTGESDV